MFNYRQSQKLYSKLIAGLMISSSLIVPFNATTVDAATPSYVTVYNNVGMADTVSFNGVVVKDVVKIYNSTGDKLLGTATATKAGSVSVVLKEQFSESKIKVSLTRYNSLESQKVEADVPDELLTTQPEVESFT
ncbi:MAG: hypothetical protein ACQET8_13710, partial [Bacillota bacterium]